MDKRDLLTVGEAAEYLRISRSALYPYVMRGELRSVRIGRSRRIPTAAIVEFVAKLEDAEYRS